MSIVDYVEVGPRMFEVRAEKGPLFTLRGIEALCIVRPTEQVILVDDRVSDEERGELLHEAVSAALPRGWRHVPIAGMISAV